LAICKGYRREAPGNSLKRRRIVWGGTIWDKNKRGHEVYCQGPKDKGRWGKTGGAGEILERENR